MRRNILLGLAAVLVLALGLRWNPWDLKLKAGLQVTTNNIPASLFLDGAYLEKSPFIDKKIQPKAYVLRIEPEDPSFAPYELPVNLHKGTVTVVTWKPAATLEETGGVVYEMEKIEGNSMQLAFQTVPDEAIITVDGGAKQFSPLLLNDLSEGNHEFEVSLPSYQTQQHSVNLLKGHKVTVNIILGKTNTSLSTPTQSETDSGESPPINGLAGPRVQILPTNFFFNNQEVLRVRESPSPVGRELGFVPVGETFRYLDEQTGWFQIEFENAPGWISSQFSQKIATESSQPAR